MQPAQLAIGTILTYAAAAHATREVVSREIGSDRLWRYDYAALARRVAQAANMFTLAGLGSGDRISSLPWSTPRHLSSEERRAGEDWCVTRSSRCEPCR